VSKTRAQALAPARLQFPDAYSIRYMHDILLASSEESQLHLIFDNTRHALAAFGLCIGTEKVQKQAPYSYLGHIINGSLIKPTLPQLRFDDFKTFSDFQKLSGDINWLHPTLKLTTGDLKPLFDVHKGDSDPSSPQVLTPPAKEAIQMISKALRLAQVTRIDLAEPLHLLLMATEHTPTATVAETWLLGMAAFTCFWVLYTYTFPYPHFFSYCKRPSSHPPSFWS
jgi:hypothetical protein